MNDYDIESAGSLDGESDANLGMAEYSSYGAGIDLNALTDRQRALYDNAYHSSHQAIENLEDDNFDDELGDDIL